MVMVRQNFFLIFVVTVIYISDTIASQKLLLSVFYESNCPDSKNFILHQLRPAMRLLHDHVNLQFIPFGKSKSINYGDEGFECQHGSTECLGNMVQDCALFHMKDANDRQRLQYVACEMTTEAGSQGDLQCVRQANLSENAIEECVLKDKGTILQLESEYYTSLIRPTFVPSVTYNGVYDQELQDNSQVDLFGTVCSLLPDIPPCAQHYNSMALSHIMQKPKRLANLV